MGVLFRQHRLVELGGIEPPSARWLPNLLRPFPTLQLTAAEPAGRLTPKGPLPGLSLASAVFLAVSGLSLRSTPTSVAGLWGSGPVRHRWSRFSSRQLIRSGGESELLILGGSFFVPVLRVRDNSGRKLDFQVPTSKPVSPVAPTSVLDGVRRARWEFPLRASGVIGGLAPCLVAAGWQRLAVRPIQRNDSGERSG